MNCPARGEEEEEVVVVAAAVAAAAGVEAGGAGEALEVMGLLLEVNPLIHIKASEHRIRDLKGYEQQQRRHKSRSLHPNLPTESRNLRHRRFNPNP